MASWTKLSTFNTYIALLLIYVLNYALHICKYLKFLWVPKFISPWFPLCPHLIQVSSIFWSHADHYVNHDHIAIFHKLLITLLEMCLPYFWWSTEDCGGNTACTTQGPSSFSSTHHASSPKPQSCHVTFSTKVITLRNAAQSLGMASSLAVNIPSWSPVLSTSLRTSVTSTVLHLLILMLLFC